MTPNVSKVLLAGSLVMALVAALAIWVVFWWSTEVDANTLAQRSTAQSEALADRLVSGKALHVRFEFYRRHGPAAPQISAAAQTPVDPIEFYPERYYADIWHTVGTGSNVISERWVVDGADGTNYAKGYVQDGQKTTQWLRSDTEETAPFTSYSIRSSVLGFANLAASLPGGGFQLVGTGQWEDGRETAIFENRSPLALRPKSPGQTGFSVPYFDDLNPTELIQRVEMVVDNPMIALSQQWTVDYQGNRTLIQARKTVLVDVIDASAIPG